MAEHRAVSEQLLRKWVMTGTSHAPDGAIFILLRFIGEVCWCAQRVKALNKRAEDEYPLLKDVCGKDGTAVIKKKIMMLFVNATKSKNQHPPYQCCLAFSIVLRHCALSSEVCHLQMGSDWPRFQRHWPCTVYSTAVVLPQSCPE